MALREKKELNGEMGMSSMTDIIFILLIFFMMVSTMEIMDKSRRVVAMHNGMAILTIRLWVAIAVRRRNIGPMRLQRLRIKINCATF